MNNAMILLDDGLMVSIGMTPYAVDKSHPNYSKVLEAAKAGDWDAIPNLVNISKAIKTFVGNYGDVDVDVDNGVVMYNGEELHGTLTDRLLRMMNEGFDVKPLVNFLSNLMQNPSKRSIDELYGFLEYGKMPITEDGHFLAYKRVNDDYTSVHDGKTDNSIGKIVEMPRNKVDDDKDRTCSHGLHFCSHGYLSNFSGCRVVVLKVNPRDVVSIPSDYNNTKGRACRYEVVGELTPAEVEKAMNGRNWGASVNTNYDDADRDFENEEGEEDYEYVTQDYLDGYNRGRVAGRASSPYMVASGNGDFAKGYDRGYKDGKGHKAMPRLIVDEDQAMAGDEKDYVEGYKDGRARFEDGLDVPLAVIGSDAYRNGYFDGYNDAEAGETAEY